MSAVFLLSSLPTLELGAEAPFSIEECRHRFEGIEGVNPDDFDAVINGVCGSHQFTIDYANALIEIKNITAAMRASKWEDEHIKITERPYSGCHVILKQKIADALNLSNPLEREMELERIRWELVEELAGIDYFSEAKVYAYVAKLQINNRFSGLNEEAGKAVIEEFIKANDHEVAK